MKYKIKCVVKFDSVIEAESEDEAIQLAEDSDIDDLIINGYKIDTSIIQDEDDDEEVDDFSYDDDE